MFVKVACWMVDAEMLYSMQKKEVIEVEEKQEQVNNDNKVNQLVLMIIAARIEQPPLQIPCRQKSDDDGFFLYFNEYWVLCYKYKMAHLRFCNGSVDFVFNKPLNTCLIGGKVICCWFICFFGIWKRNKVYKKEEEDQMLKTVVLFYMIYKHQEAKIEERSTWSNDIYDIYLLQIDVSLKTPIACLFCLKYALDETSSFFIYTAFWSFGATISCLLFYAIKKMISYIYYKYKYKLYSWYSGLCVENTFKLNCIWKIKRI